MIINEEYSSLLKHRSAYFQTPCMNFRKLSIKVKFREELDWKVCIINWSTLFCSSVSRGWNFCDSTESLVKYNVVTFYKRKVLRKRFLLDVVPVHLPSANRIRNLVGVKLSYHKI